MKKLALITATAALFISSPLFANQTYVCTHGSQQRTITVEYQTVGEPVPCEVTYEKSSGKETLWNAMNQAGYCEEKAEAFVEKQRGWGWDCNITE